jgi:hypothetical protein
MNRSIAAAAFAAAQWQTAHAQAILGSIPEEFRGYWCWLESSNGLGNLQGWRAQAQG